MSESTIDESMMPYTEILHGTQITAVRVTGLATWTRRVHVANHCLFLKKLNHGINRIEIHHNNIISIT